MARFSIVVGIKVIILGESFHTEALEEAIKAKRSVDPSVCVTLWRTAGIGQFSVPIPLNLPMVVLNHNLAQ